MVLAAIAPLPTSERTALVFLELYAIQFVTSALALAAVWSAKTQLVGVLYFLPLLQYVLQAMYLDRRLKVERRNVPLTAAILFLCIVVADRVHYTVYDYYAKLF